MGIDDVVVKAEQLDENPIDPHSPSPSAIGVKLRPSLSPLLGLFPVSASAFSLFLGLGVRSAVRQVRVNKSDVPEARLVSGVWYASRALALATVISVSGVALCVVAVSVLLNVDTPREFGQKMTDLFGARYRLKGSEIKETWEDFSRRLS